MLDLIESDKLVGAGLVSEVPFTRGCGLGSEHGKGRGGGGCWLGERVFVLS